MVDCSRIECSCVHLYNCVLNWYRPTISIGAIGASLLSPFGIGIVVTSGLVTAGALYLKYGQVWDGIVEILVHLARWDSEDLLLEGRIIYDDLAWHVEYDGNDRYEVTQRECSFCGRKVIESYLPKHVVHGPNSAFDSTTSAEKAAADVWEDVLGNEKFENRDQMLALACPQCNHHPR